MAHECASEGGLPGVAAQRAEGPRSARRGRPPLTPEQREWLGLAPDESVRVLASNARTIVLERSAPPEATPLPWDRDLVLAADVRAFSIADVLGLVHAAGKSGFLFFQGGGHEKAVYLHRGEVVFAASNQSVDRLGECLLRTGAIRLEQLRDARRAYAPPGLFGRVLVERGVLTPRDLWNGVKAQVEEIVRSLFSYDAGSVLFFEGEVRPDNVVRLSLPTRRLVAEGLRRRDELLRFLAWLEDPRVELEAVEGAAADLSGTERALHEASAPRATFAEACRRAGVDPLSGARVLHHLRLVGAVRIAERADAAPGLAVADTRTGDAEAVRECVGAHVKLLTELAAPIVAVEGGDALRARLQRVVDEAGARFPELLGGLALGRCGALDPEALTERALRFPGDRERGVGLALGELVAYLEFELLNHPRIPEPDQFLEALEPLRARL
jgi:hypothetical protein